MAENKRTQKIITENSQQNNQRPLSRGRSVVGPRPLPSNNTQRADQSSNSHSTMTPNLLTQHALPDTITPERSRSTSPGTPPFPPLVSPRPQKPLPTVQSDITRALEESQYPDNDTKYLASDDKEISSQPRQQQQLYHQHPHHNQQPSPQSPNGAPPPPLQQQQQQQQYYQPQNGQYYGHPTTQQRSLSRIDENAPIRHQSHPENNYNQNIPQSQQFQQLPQVASRNLNDGNQIYHQGQYGRPSEETTLAAPIQYNGGPRSHSSAPPSPIAPMLSFSQGQGGPNPAFTPNTGLQPHLNLVTDPNAFYTNGQSQVPGAGVYSPQLANQGAGVYSPQLGNQGAGVYSPQLANQGAGVYSPQPGNQGITNGQSHGIYSPQPGNQGIVNNNWYANRPHSYNGMPHRQTSPSYIQQRQPSPLGHGADNRMSVASMSRSPNVNLRLLIDEKNAKRMRMISLTLVSDEKAIKNYSDAAARTNDPQVQVDYAKFLIEMHRNLTTPNADPNQGKSGIIVRLEEEAIIWIDKLAKQNQPEALYIKGTWYEEGVFRKEKSEDKALKYYLSASKQGFPKATRKAAEYYEKQRNFQRAISFLQKAASLGDVRALYRLALAYMYGEIKLEINFKQALIYLKQAANKANEDCPEGAFVYGMILAKEDRIFGKEIKIPDELVVPDPNEAKELVQKAAEFGYGPALLKMGYWHEYAIFSCPSDPTLSLSYYERAAEKGEVEAHMALSKWYLCGAESYFDQNEKLAYEHAEKAANAGLPAAEFAMGYFHEVGINNMTPDPGRANVWYKKAADKGNEDARQRLAQGPGGAITRTEHESTMKDKKKNRKPGDKDCVIQ